MTVFLVWKGLKTPLRELENDPCGIVKEENKDRALEKLAQRRNGKVITNPKDIIDNKHVRVGSTVYYVMGEIDPNLLIL